MTFGSMLVAPHDPLRVPTLAVVIGEVSTSMYLWPMHSLRRHLFDAQLRPGTRWLHRRGTGSCQLAARCWRVCCADPTIRVRHDRARSLQEGAAGKSSRVYVLACGARDTTMIRRGDRTSMRRALEQICCTSPTSSRRLPPVRCPWPAPRWPCTGGGWRRASCCQSIGRGASTSEPDQCDSARRPDKSKPVCAVIHVLACGAIRVLPAENRCG